MIRQATLTDAPAGATVGTGVPTNPFRFMNVVVAWGPGCSAGAVAVKAADRASDASDWPTLATVNFDAARMAVTPSEGYQDVVEIVSPHGAVRADASGVAGGVVNAAVQAWGFGGQ